jgi:hypothetical protein
MGLNRIHRCTVLLALLMTAGASRQVLGAPFIVTRWSVSGGGGSALQAGPYRLGGTIGQRAAGRFPSLNYTFEAGFWRWNDPTLTAVGEPPDQDPGTPGAPNAREVRIHPAAPNPLIDHTRIAFDLPDARAVEIRVFSPHGGLVRTLATGSRAAGRHGVEWDTRDGAGHRVPPGLYFVRVRLGTFEKSQKLVVVQ